MKHVGKIDGQSIWRGENIGGESFSSRHTVGQSHKIGQLIFHLESCAEDASHIFKVTEFVSDIIFSVQPCIKNAIGARIWAIAE